MGTKAVTNGRTGATMIVPDDAAERAAMQAAALVKAKRDAKKLATAADTMAFIAKYKDAVGYKKLIPLITPNATGTRRVLTARVAVDCQKKLQSCQTADDVREWLAANVATLTPRNAGRLLAYAGTDAAKLAG